MQRILLSIDGLSTWVGKAFAWCIVVLTFAISYEVFARYVMRAPTTWAFDVSYILYGTLFMMAGAYTLSRNGHVRGDFVYRTWPARVQASLDLALYLLFYFPAIAALIYSGWGFFKLSYAMNEHSAFSPAGPPIWPFKLVIPVAGVLMALQGLAEVIRAIITLSTGRHPRRLHDVEELENNIIEQVARQREQEEAAR
ncbi:MAG: TRAP transporter small permease subunit [Candidatus Lambdaproteobacteria bacterium]|nr:TRAP transporter small permease subunit [Candidatus Lambdaproteobacteria bacterium]